MNILEAIQNDIQTATHEGQSLIDEVSVTGDNQLVVVYKNKTFVLTPQLKDENYISLVDMAQNEGYRIINHILWTKGMNNCEPSEEELKQYILILTTAGYKIDKIGIKDENTI